jgi:hypothetical protein
MPELPERPCPGRDGSFGPAYTRRIRAMGIRDRPTAARSPWQNGHVERLSSIRRECMDHTVVFSEAHLHCILRSYVAYYNQVRTLPEQERTGRSNRSAHRANYRRSAPRRNTSSIRSDLIFGNDRSKRFDRVIQESPYDGER